MFHLKIEDKRHVVNTAYSSSEAEAKLHHQLGVAIANERFDEARSVVGKVAALYILRTLPSVIETNRVDLAIEGILQAYLALDASPSNVEAALCIADYESFAACVKDLLYRIKRWDDGAFHPVGMPATEETCLNCSKHEDGIVPSCDGEESHVERAS